MNQQQQRRSPGPSQADLGGLGFRWFGVYGFWGFRVRGLGVRGLGFRWFGVLGLGGFWVTGLGV